MHRGGFSSSIFIQLIRQRDTCFLILEPVGFFDKYKQP